MQQTVLSIRGVELPVFLGWITAERQREQMIYVDVDITFPQAPSACLSDDLADTFCYATLVTQLRDFLHQREFKLVEHITHEIFQFIQKQLTPGAKIKLALTKFPKVPGLTQGVRFSLEG